MAKAINLSDDDDLFDDDDLSDNNNDDFSNGSKLEKDEEYENEAELREPCVTEADIGKALTSDEWMEVQALVEDYRSKIPKTRCLYK